MKPVVHEHNGVKVAVAVQVQTGSCSGSHGGPSSDERERRAEARAELFEFLGDFIKFGAIQAVFVFGLLFALGFWTLGRVGDALRAMEASMGGSRRRLVQGMLPVWLRSDEPEPPQDTYRLPRGHAMASSNELRLTTGDEHEELDLAGLDASNRREQSRQRVARREPARGSRTGRQG